MYIDLGNNGRGAWVMSDGGLTWMHDYTSNAIQHLDVNLLNIRKTNSAGSCLDPDHVYPVHEFTATYGPMGNPRTMHVSLTAAGSFQAHFDDAGDNTERPFWVSVNAGGGLRTITLTDFTTTPPTTETCTFSGGHRGIITIHQSASATHTPGDLPHTKK